MGTWDLGNRNYSTGFGEVLYMISLYLARRFAYWFSVGNKGFYVGIIQG